MATSRSHIPALDGMRGLAILLVLVLHLTPWGQSQADRRSAHVVAFGASGVDLFFVLSGFLITRILWTNRSVGRFWLRRVLRIWPLYVGALTVLFVVIPAIKGWRQYPMPELWADRWYYWLHATNIKPAVADFAGVAHGAKDLPYNTGHFWSLAVEEQFYLLWPLLVVRITTLRGLLRMSCFTIVASWLLRVLIGAVLGHPVAEYVLMPTRMDGLAFGAAIFALSAMGRLTSWRRLAQAVAVITLVNALAVSDGSPCGRTAVRLAQSTFHAALVTIVLTGSPGVFDRPWLRIFGRYSYGIYVIHSPLRLVLGPLKVWCLKLPTIGGWSLPGVGAYFIGATTLSLALAMVSFHLYERHFLALKDRLSLGGDAAGGEPMPGI